MENYILISVHIHQLYPKRIKGKQFRHNLHRICSTNAFCKELIQCCIAAKATSIFRLMDKSNHANNKTNIYLLNAFRSENKLYTAILYESVCVVGLCKKGRNSPLYVFCLSIVFYVCLLANLTYFFIHRQTGRPDQD